MQALKRAVKDLRNGFYRVVIRQKVANQQGIQLLLDHPEISPKMFGALRGHYENEDSELASRWLTSEDRVLEAGSSIGFVSLFCRVRLGISDYAMVEANSRLQDLMAKNYSLNGLDLTDYPLVTGAVAAEDGSMSFHIGADFWSSSTVSRSNQVDTVTVPAYSIATILKMLRFKPNALIMDIEGGEVGIPAEHFASFDKIIMETHARLVGDEATEKLLNGLKVLGFVQRDRIDDSIALIRA